MSKKTNAERFLTAYNNLDYGLRSIYGFKRSMSFSDVVRRSVVLNSVVRKYEDDLIDFAGEFGYRYINSEDAHEDFNRIIRSLKYSLMCDLKKAIASSIDDKENITSRYNTIYKEILNPEKLAR